MFGVPGWDACERAPAPAAGASISAITARGSDAIPELSMAGEARAAVFERARRLFHYRFILLPLYSNTTSVAAAGCG
jgi:hypothetical protein